MLKERFLAAEVCLKQMFAALDDDLMTPLDPAWRQRLLETQMEYDCALAALLHDFEQKKVAENSPLVVARLVHHTHFPSTAYNRETMRLLMQRWGIESEIVEILDEEDVDARQK